MLSIIVPTYNERDNLPELIPRLDAALSQAGIPYEVVVVDDDSPDRTWELAQRFSKDHPVRAVRRTEERGLATAVLRGVEEARYDHLLVMDADLQHPPEKVPELFAALEGGAQVAVGSRFVEGGDVGDFGPARIAISKSADLMARTLFHRIRGVKDIQSGFFAFRRGVVEDVDLSPTGYKILLEVLVLGDYEEVVEVPFAFGQRHGGESKLGVREMVNYLAHLVSLAWRAREVHRAIQFGLVGAIGAVVNLSLFTLLTFLGSHYLLAGALAIEGGLLTNFTINRVWTFRDRGVSGKGQVLRSLGRDHVVRSGGLAINLAVLFVLTAWVGFLPVISQAVGIAAAMGWNFLGNKWWTWETSRPADTTDAS